LAGSLRSVNNQNLTGLFAIDLLGCQKLDNPHYTLATRAVPNRRFRGVWYVRWRGSRQQCSAQWQKHTAAAIRQKTEVPNARQAPREDMFQKTAEEFLVS
jgi:hypothetical protein